MIYIDTKYDFDIVKEIRKTDVEYLGKPFMILELENHTTLKATYPIKALIKQINRASKIRTYFVERYLLVPEGYFLTLKILY